MISELFGLLAGADVGNVKGKFNISLNKRRIRSISSFSSNSIFYFPLVVSDQCTLEEVTMMSRALEKQYATFVVSCISLMPFHRIRSGDQSSIEDYLKQFHQNMGISAGGTDFGKIIDMVDSLEESATTPEDAQNFFLNIWQNAVSKYSDPVVHLRESYESLQTMYNEDALDSYTRILMDRYNRINEEMSEWGFIGNEPPEYDLDDDELDDIDDDIDEDEFDDSLLDEAVDPKIKKLLDPIRKLVNPTFDELYEKHLDLIRNTGAFGANTSYIISDLTTLINKAENEDQLNKAHALCKRWNFGMSNSGQQALFDGLVERKRKRLKKAVSESFTFDDEIMDESVKAAVAKIKFSLESIPDNKIKNCSNLTKLRSLESKLKTLKRKYANYLKRYKKKYNENKKSGSKSKLKIRFNNMSIDDPKAFMKQYGTYVKIINRKLKLIEKRRAELRSRKGLSEAVDNIMIDEMHLDYLIETIDKDLNAPDDMIFELITEAGYDDLDDDNPILNYKSDKAYNGYSSKKTADTEVRVTRYRNFKDIEDKNDLRGPKDDINAARAAGAQKLELKTFGDRVFTDMDMKKANDMIPTFTKASIGFIVDETEEVVSRDVVIGIKTYVHRAPTAELINDLYTSIINKRKFLKFVKFISGEEKSLADLLFGIRELKTDALSGQTKSTKWKAAFQRRKRWQKMSIPYLMKEYTPNGTVIITMNEVDYIRENFGIDLMKNDHIKMLMDQNFLLGFVILDQANELVYVMYDGHNYQFQEYSYNQLERESNLTNRELTNLYRNFSR